MERVRLQDSCRLRYSGWEPLSEAIPHSVHKDMGPWPWWSVALSWICQGLSERLWKKPRSKLSPYCYRLPFPLGLWHLTSDKESGMDWLVAWFSGTLWWHLLSPIFFLMPCRKRNSLKCVQPRIFHTLFLGPYTMVKVLNKKSAQLLAACCSQPHSLLLTKLRKPRTFCVQPGKSRPSLSSWRKVRIMWRFKSDAADTFTPWSSQTRNRQSSWSSPCSQMRQRRSGHEASLLMSIVWTF